MPDNGRIDELGGGGIPEEKPADPDPVLIVDDQAPTRHLLTVTLAEAGIDAVEAADGQQALDLIAHGRFSLVLLDVHMPGLSGIEVLERLREQRRTRTLPVILLTADGDVPARVRGLQAGADDYISKPFDLDELVARVGTRLRGHAAWQDELEAHLRERAAVASAVGRIDAASAPERTAEIICAELTSAGDRTGAALVAFLGDGLAIPLAVDQLALWGMKPGRPLALSAARYLAGRAGHGPWVERLGGPFDEGIPSSPVQAGLHVACAPLLRGDAVLGLLLLGADPPDGEAAAADVSRSLASAIDFAAFAGGVLAPSLSERRGHRHRIARLEGILRASAYGTVFQPVVRLADLEIVGYEALTRFSDGVPPELRFAEAARLGLGHRLELATMEAAVRAAHQLPDGPWLAFNASPSLLISRTPEVAAILDQRPGPKVLELSEHDRVDDYPELRAALDRLGAQVRLSIDDAGSGFASLRHVLALGPAFMKLDRSWITGIDTDHARQALVAGLAHFSRSTGCRLVAEGVEHDAELAVLRQIDADLGQGFLLGRPAAIR